MPLLRSNVYHEQNLGWLHQPATCSWAAFTGFEPQSVSPYDTRKVFLCLAGVLPFLRIFPFLPSRIERFWSMLTRIVHIVAIGKRSVICALGRQQCCDISSWVMVVGGEMSRVFLARCSRRVLSSLWQESMERIVHDTYHISIYSMRLIR